MGNELGAGNPLSAKRASYVAIILQSKYTITNQLAIQLYIAIYFMTLWFFLCTIEFLCIHLVVIAVILSAVVFALRNHIGKLFSHEE